MNKNANNIELRLEAFATIETRARSIITTELEKRGKTGTHCTDFSEIWTNPETRVPENRMGYMCHWFDENGENCTLFMVYFVWRNGPFGGPNDPVEVLWNPDKPVIEER
jgi:hypothetical protein